MATLTISLTSNVVTGSRSFTISEADVQKFVDWARVAYALPGAEALTPAQALVAWARSVVDSAAAQVRQRQNSIAIVGVPDISFS